MRKPKNYPGKTVKVTILSKDKEIVKELIKGVIFQDLGKETCYFNISEKALKALKTKIVNENIKLIMWI